MVNTCWKAWKIGCTQAFHWRNQKKIDLSNDNLEGSLEWSCSFEFHSDSVKTYPCHHEIFDCSNNKLSILKINFGKIRKINCRNNQLEGIGISEADWVTHLDFSYNQWDGYLAGWLANLLNRFGNLRELRIAGNPLVGSLEPLKRLTKLVTLDISNTQINSGLEFLPDNLVDIYCDGCSEIEKKLERYQKKDNKGFKCYDYQGWRQNKLTKLASNADKVEELIDSIGEKREKIVNEYQNFTSERELLKEFIVVNSELFEAKRKKMPIFELRKQRDKIYYSMVERFGEDKAEEIQNNIINDCEELSELEVRLEDKINSEKSITEFIKNGTIIMGGMTINITNGNAVVGNTIGDNPNLSSNYQQEISPRSNWTDISSEFANKNLVEDWINHNFTYSQAQEWIAVGLTPAECDFASWLRDTKNLTSEQFLNHSNETELRQEYQQLLTNIEIPPK